MELKVGEKRLLYCGWLWPEKKPVPKIAVTVMEIKNDGIIRVKLPDGEEKSVGYEWLIEKERSQVVENEVVDPTRGHPNGIHSGPRIGRRQVVSPKGAEGFNMSLAQLFGSGPKWTITCGNCERTFQKRIPMVNYPEIQCPHCDTANKLPLTVDDEPTSIGDPISCGPISPQMDFIIDESIPLNNEGGRENRKIN